MRPFVAIFAIPLRRLSTQSDQPDRSEAADSLDTPAGNRSVPDNGVACIGSEAQSVFVPAEDVAQVSADRASVDGEAWIKTDATIDVEGWA